MRDDPSKLLWPETEPASSLAGEIASLVGMDRHALRIAFRKAFRRDAPEGIGRTLLIRMIAWRVQVRAHGELNAAEETLLAGLLAEHRVHDRRKAGESARADRDGADPRSGRAGARASRQHRPGTMLFREYGGEMHRVKILHDGYEWKGERFASLSQIARAITGTNWNGPRFFGLREKASP